MEQPHLMKGRGRTADLGLPQERREGAGSYQPSSHASSLSKGLLSSHPRQAIMFHMLPHPSSSSPSSSTLRDRPFQSDLPAIETLDEGTDQFQRASLSVRAKLRSWCSVC